MKVLVTGATGLLGSHIVERLVAQGYQVRALARKTSDPTPSSHKAQAIFRFH